MRQIALMFIVFLFAGAPICKGQNNDLSNKFLNDSLEVIQQRIEKLIIPARYMAGKVISETDTIKGWETIKVTLYEYTVDQGKKTGRVYMANADARKLASWVITTCVTLTNTLEKGNTDFLIKSIRYASGGQFPVKGIVYENMDGKGYFPYLFKDGVTVFLTEATAYDLNLINDNNIVRVGKYARIISTTRGEYNSLFPNVNTADKEWLKVVRDEYKLALKSDKNNLMIAWSKGKLK